MSEEAYEMVIDNAESLKLEPGNFHLLPAEESRLETTLPYDNNFFDAIVSNQVIYYIPDREQIEEIVSEFYRILKPGGKIVCTVMSEDSYFFTEHGESPLPESGPVQVKIRGRIHRDNILYRFKNEHDVSRLFEEAGFEIVDLGFYAQSYLDISYSKHYVVSATKPRND